MNTLLVIHLWQETHASEIARTLDFSLSQTQKALNGPEIADIVVGSRVGREKRVKLNPRFLAIEELKALLDKITEYDVELHKKVTETRRRPRRVGKEL